MGLGDVFKKVVGAVPVVGDIASAGLDILGSIMGNKSADEAAKAQQILYNEWLKPENRLKDLNTVADGLKARGIDIFGPQVTTTNQQAQNEVHSIMNQTTVSDLTKTVGAGQQPMYEKLNRLLTSRLSQREFVTPEERAAAEAATGQMQRTAKERIGNAVSRMGLAPSSVQAAMMETPADVAANQARLQALASFAGVNREEAGKARAESAAQLAQWQGQHQKSKTSGTTDTYGTSSGTSTTTGPPPVSSFLNFLLPQGPPTAVTGTGYSATGDLLQAGGNLLGRLTDIYGNRKKPGDPGYTMPSDTHGGAFNTLLPR